VRLVFITLLALVIASAIGLGSTYMTATKGTEIGTLKIGAWTARPKSGTSDIDPYSRAIIVRSGELPVGTGDGVAFTATTEIAAIPLHVAVACAFVHGNEDLANQAKLRLAASDPITGQLTLQTGETRRFKDITDSDDAIGRMLETYCGDGLLYFPFNSLRRVEVLPKTSFMDHLMPKVQITDEHGTALAYVPLLYAGSSTSPSPELRSGRGTVFQYLGEARRGHGQRDLMIDGGGLVGWHVISAIDFD